MKGKEKGRKEPPAPEERDDGETSEKDSSKGAGRKHDVQRDPEDQKGRADPKEGEGRGAF